MGGSRLLSVSLAAAVLVAGCALFGACGDSVVVSQGDGGSTGGVGGQPVVDGGAGGSSSGGAEGGTGGAGAAFDAGQTDGWPDAEICGSLVADPVEIPLDMFVLLDRSGSMAGTLWTGTVSGLSQFFTDPSSADISAALSYFPPPNGDECDPASYNPPHVPLVLLGTDAQTLVNHMSSISPTGLTPIYSALMGTLQFATAHKDQNPEHAVTVILAADGDPTACDTSIANVAALAASAYSYNGVQTCTIGLPGATMSNLSQIAQAGGCQAFDVGSDITLFAIQFKAAMAGIVQQALGCEYFIPEFEGQELDPTKVDITYIPGDGGPPETIPQADNPSDCGNQPGWYFDNPLEPTRIILCPASCTVIRSDPDAQVEVAMVCVQPM